MSAEYTWDQLIADHEREIAFQEKYIVIPTFQAKILVEETLPILRKAQEKVFKKEHQRGIRTNVSQIEIIYPYLLQKAGLVSEDLPEWAVSERVNEAVILGQVLHRADSIYSVALNGIKGNLLRSYLPTYSKEELDRIDFAVRDIHIPEDADQETVRDKMITAWARYRNQLRPPRAANLPLPGFGIVDPRKERAFEQSSEIDKQAYALAEAWAREAVKPTPITWEFQRGGSVINQREVLAAIKFMGPNLQFIAKFDSIVRRRPTEGKKTSGKVRAQIVDLKTGSRETSSGLHAEIQKRQAQVMRVMVERFTSKYLTRFKSLKPRDYAFVMKAMHDSRALKGRVHLAGYRYFDQTTGQMGLNKVGFANEKDRKDFNLWLSWYGTMIHYYEDEVRDLISRKPNYKLGSIDFPEDGLKRLYKDN